MDHHRHLLIATCASLSRLLLRLQSQLASMDYSNPSRINSHPHWMLADLQPPSPWLEGTPPMALSGVERKVVLVIAHLLAMVAAPGAVDGRHACVVLQELGGVGWCDPAQRLAAQLGITLPPDPIDAHHGLSLSSRDFPMG